MKEYEMELDETIKSVSKLQVEKSKLEKRIKLLKKSAMNILEAEGLIRFETESGKLAIVTRTTAVYPEEIDAKIKRLKQRAEEDGKVDFKSSKSVKVTPK